MNNDETEVNDVNQDIARSAFADMILDHDRNQRYKIGLGFVIEEKHLLGDVANVVDIGTGSGLLSLAAASCGADHVTAVEMFKPVADVAEKIFKKSKFANKIDLIKSRSTDLENHHNLKKGNIIVAEVFDTELIGEGALRTFKEAHGSLVEKKSRVVPSSARIWVLPVHSTELQKFNCHPKLFKDSKFLSSCNGLSTAFDFQMSQLLPGSDFQALCKPFIAFSFNFEDPDSILYHESFVHDFIVESSECLENQLLLTFDSVFLWWDLDMDGRDKNYITMAPTWLDPSSVWRDHWMQAAYYLPNSVSVNVGEKVSLRCSHDEFTFWFSILPNENLQVESLNSCLLHSICARSAFYRMNDLESQNGILDSLQKFCNGKSVICLNEGSLLGLYAAKTANFVTIIDDDNFFNQILQSLRLELNLKNVQVLSNVSSLCEKYFSKLLNIHDIVIISEPFFFSSVLTIHNLSKLKDGLLKIQEKLQSFGVEQSFKLKCFVKTFRIKALSVKFDYLWKTVADIGTVLDFDLSQFNEFYQNARHKSDYCIEAHPLWEYSSIATGMSCTIYEVELNNTTDAELKNVEFVYYPKIESTNAIILWTEMEYIGTNKSSLILSTGLLEDCKIEAGPKWHRGHRQGVYFLPQKNKLDIIKGIKISFNLYE